MKKLLLIVFTISFIGLFSYPISKVNAQGVGINPSGNAANSSAALDVDFSNKGLLIPRMTTAQRDAIGSPAEGLQIFNTTTKCFEAFVNGAWNTISCPTACVPATPGAIIGNTTPCANTMAPYYVFNSVSGATNYTWTVPSGWSIIGGQGTTSITVITGSSGQNGNISITAGNSCGTSNESTVAVTINPGMPASVSIAANPSGTVCPGTSVTFTATPTNGGTTPAYQWKVNGTNVGTNSPNYTSNTLVNGDAVTCVMNSDLACVTGSPATSAPIVMTVYTEHTIGESFGGGIIFYLTGSCPNQHGLIAATGDQSTGAEWGCYATPISGADGTAIGTGSQNTTDIISGCATAGIAAKVCRDYTGGGFNDWFLPSRDELNELYLQKAVVGGFANNWYWSSSEVNANAAWWQLFIDGTQANTFTKNNPTYVRAVRAF